MKNILFLICFASLFFACGNAEKMKKEVAKKEQELEVKTEEVGQTSSNIDAKGTYKTYKPCSFSIALPSHFQFIPMEPEETNPDYCDYKVKTADNFQVIEIYSLSKGRFEFESIKEAYEGAIKQSKIDITYKIQKENWFVISGYEDDSLVYWKRAIGGNFVSDLFIKYPKTKKAQIEPYIAKISQSFHSQ